MPDWPLHQPERPLRQMSSWSAACRSRGGGQADVGENQLRRHTERRARVGGGGVFEAWPDQHIRVREAGHATGDTVSAVKSGGFGGSLAHRPGALS